MNSSKFQNRDSKLEGDRKWDRVSNFEFGVSNGAPQVSGLGFRAVLLLLIFAASACKRSQPQPTVEVDQHVLAGHFRSVVATAGGAQIWIKRPAKLPHGQGSDTSLQVVATPGGYRAVLSAVEQESSQGKLDLRKIAVGGGSRPAVDLNISQHGQRIIQVHLREVPRLLRAAIVIDDMGQDLEAAHRLLALPYPLAFSVLPHLRLTRTTAEDIHRAGREVMLHLPMEAEPGTRVPPGKGAIFTGMSKAEVERTIQNDLVSVSYAVGVNNHMGSLATQDAALMTDVMKVLNARRLYFIDSRTTAGTRALDAARTEGLPAFYRSVFLDDTETVPYTLKQLHTFRQVVEREGVALAIGHPHPTTIAALARFLPELDRADIELVSPSEIVRLPEIASLHPPAKPGS